MNARFVVFASLFAVGCYVRHDPLQANGDDDVLYFSGVSAPDAGVVPLGTSRTIQVDRLPGGDVTCHLGGLSKHDGLSLQGGGHPDIPEKCDQPPAYPIELDSATCDGDACDVTSTFESAHLTLHVSGKMAAATKLHVVVHGTNDGVVHEDSIAIAFAPAARIALEASPTDLMALRAPVLPGVTFMAANATVVDSQDNEMSIDDGTLVFTTTGDAFTLDEYQMLTAVKPGHTTLTWTLPGSITRTIDIEAVSASEIASIEVSPSQAYTFQSAVDFDATTSNVSAPISSISVTNAGATFTTRAVLTDGRRALPFIETTTVTPASLGIDVEPELFEPWSFTIWSAPVVGQGTLDVTLNGHTVALPLSITS